MLGLSILHNLFNIYKKVKKPINILTVKLEFSLINSYFAKIKNIVVNTNKNIITFSICEYSIYVFE